MLRKPKLASSRSLIAALAGLASTLPLGAALAQTTTGNSQDQASTGSRHADKKTLTELTKELKKDDKQERQANEELKQSRERLARTQRQLEQAKAQEQHLASAEHHTAKGAKQAGQNAEHAEARSSAQPPASEPSGGQPRTPE